MFFPWVFASICFLSMLVAYYRSVFLMDMIGHPNEKPLRRLKAMCEVLLVVSFVAWIALTVSVIL